MKITKTHYGAIDGLRTLACFGIVIRHVLANGNYNMSGFICDTFVPSLTWLVYLFIMISGFGMCVGYLEKIQNKTVDFESFYKKRYGKILPFFGFLILIALVMEPSMSNVYEASVELALLHGLLPNNSLNVIGVSWTLGVIFVFYLVFPAFSVLMKNKKRALLSLAASFWINFACAEYLFGEIFVTELFEARHTFLYCLPMFIGGGIVYLYREEITGFCSKFKGLYLAACIGASVLWFVIPDEVCGVETIFYKCFAVYMMWLAYAIGTNEKFLDNKVMAFFSNISMEIYLAHMVIFRLVEKIGIFRMLGNGWFSFLTACVVVLAGTVIFIEVYRWGVEILKKLLHKKELIHD